jgi:hypothetical protein
MAAISPVLAGLAIGIAFVVLLAVMFPVAVDIAAQNSFAITIDALRKNY